MTQAIEQMLVEAVAYDRDSGVLTWRPRPASHFPSPGYCRRWNTRFVGKPAFATVKSDGYMHGAFSGKFLSAHRVAWLIMHGEWPKDEIDHINRDPLDNRAVNLRAATSSENKVNCRKRVNSSSPSIGVVRLADGRFTARLSRRLNIGNLGTFGCETAARIARFRAAKAVYGEFASYG